MSSLRSKLFAKVLCGLERKSRKKAVGQTSVGSERGLIDSVQVKHSTMARADEFELGPALGRGKGTRKEEGTREHGERGRRHFKRKCTDTGRSQHSKWVSKKPWHHTSLAPQDLRLQGGLAIST